MDGPVAGDDQGAGAAYPEHDQALAAKEGLGPAPLGIDLDAGRGSEVGARLDQEGLILHLDDGDVARQGGGQGDAVALGRTGVGVEEEALLAKERATQRLEQAARGLGLQLEAGRHADHGSRFDLDVLPRLEGNHGQGV